MDFAFTLSEDIQYFPRPAESQQTQICLIAAETLNSFASNPFVRVHAVTYRV